MMRKIQAERITKEDFAPFGVYYDMINPTGYALQGELHSFYPDRMSESCMSRMAFSPLQVKRPKKMVVIDVEYHTTTPELILPLNDDMIIHVAPATGGVPRTELTKAFIVPKGTMVKLNTAIWHLAPLPVNEDMLHSIVILPECTYMNDCKVVSLTQEEQFEIIV